jgi:MFS family permease
LAGCASTPIGRLSRVIFSKYFCAGNRRRPGRIGARIAGFEGAMTTNMAGKIDAAAAASGGILSRERIVAKAGFNRWLVPPAALAIHLCIGMAYGFSVFWLPLSRSVGTATGTKVPACAGAATSFWDKTADTLTALTATNCEWTQFDLGWMFTLFFVVLGSSAAIWGGWLEHAGPRKAGVYAALCWCGGLIISAIGVRTHQLWMLWIGSGGIGGFGLGLGYISPVSTLVKWFPDRRGMATGMAIMGFGGGAMIGSPLANLLMNHFETPVSVGVWQTFVILALGYFVCMLAGAFGYGRRPPRKRP